MLGKVNSIAKRASKRALGVRVTRVAVVSQVGCLPDDSWSAIAEAEATVCSADSLDLQHAQSVAHSKLYSSYTFTLQPHYAQQSHS